MTDAELKDVLGELAFYDGRVAWPYLDKAKPPNVTIGVGCLLASAEALRELPLRHPSGALATDGDKTALFCRLLGMPGGLPAKRYFFGQKLREDDLDVLGFARLRGFLCGLSEVFPGYDEFPSPVRKALLDLAWNCGLGDRPPGLRTWAHLRAACARRDWAAAAGECTTTSSREARNAWRVACFLAAEHGAGGCLPIRIS